MSDSCSIPATPLSRRADTVNVSPNAAEKDSNPNKKKQKSLTNAESTCDLFEDQNEPLKERITQLFHFQKKQKRGGTIDVWWLYDDGGLTLLLPYIMSTRRNWGHCKLRVFALANKRDELELEHRNMASLLAKFRIDYSDLQLVPDVTNKPQESTNQFFETLISSFRKPENPNDANALRITDAELLAVKDKTDRHLRLRELLLEHSFEANMVVMTLPIPRKTIISAPLYTCWLEILTKEMPPILLVRGNQQSVLTFYS